jgi:hypothetical protein
MVHVKTRSTYSFFIAVLVVSTTHGSLLATIELEQQMLEEHGKERASLTITYKVHEHLRKAGYEDPEEVVVLKLNPLRTEKNTIGLYWNKHIWIDHTLQGADLNKTCAHEAGHCYYDKYPNRIYPNNDTEINEYGADEFAFKSIAKAEVVEIYLRSVEDLRNFRPEDDKSYLIYAMNRVKIGKRMGIESWPEYVAMTNRSNHSPQTLENNPPPSRQTAINITQPQRKSHIRSTKQKQTPPIAIDAENNKPITQKKSRLWDFAKWAAMNTLDLALYLLISVM